MTDAKAKRLVLGAMVAVGILAAARDLTGGVVPKVRIIIGAAVVAAALTATAEVAPELAASFAMLVLVTATLTAGADTINAAGDAIRGRRPLTPRRTGTSQGAQIGDALMGWRPLTR